MAEIKCPKCGEIIKLDKSDYDALLREVETGELERRLSLEVKRLKEEAEKDLEIEKLKLESKNIELQSKIDNAEKDKKIALDALTMEKSNELAKKEQMIKELESKIKNSTTQSELEITKLKDSFAQQLKDKDEEIDRYKKFRIGDSTKDIGESLEQFCQNKFNEIRPYAYPNAYFEKDNTVVEGTKGDYIFRDFADDDKENEMVSIMFEMKNQKEDGDTKNESHLAKLDKDRRKKECEYAVLVSTLEPENELYNSGIVECYQYEKMFVIRPQFFLTIIGLIKNMAKTRFAYKRQVIEYRRQNIDVTNFEFAVREVANKIKADYDNAGKQYDKVEKMCDDMIKKLTDLKEAFRLGQKWIGTAQNQLPELEVRKLTKNNPTMKEEFEKLKKDE